MYVVVQLYSRLQFYCPFKFEPRINIWTTTYCTCIDLPTSQASKAELGAEYARCKQKLSAKHRVGEWKLDLFPLQETASDVILEGIFYSLACQVGGVFQTCFLLTSVRNKSFFLKKYKNDNNKQHIKLKENFKQKTFQCLNFRFSSKGTRDVIISIINFNML